jgi:hypothetical protein
VATERTIPYGWVWLLFLMFLFVGGGMVLGSNSGLRAVGLGLLLAPLAIFGALLMIYYLKSRER